MKGNPMSFASRFLYVMLPAVSLSLLSGCAQMNLKQPSVWPFAPKEEEPGIPARVVPIWIDAVQYTQNQVPQRGFGGRLMFYDAKDEPIKVDGTLVVYAFDEEGRDPTDAAPDRKYVFPREVLDLHYGESKIGRSYSFWLPWDEVGGEHKDISLIARFLPANGPPVLSEQTTQVLPGPLPQPSRTSGELAQQRGANSAWQAQPASYEAPVAPGQTQDTAQGPAQKRMITTTIPVPGRFRTQEPLNIDRLPPGIQIPAATLQGITPYPAASGSAAGMQTGAQRPQPQHATPSPQGLLPPQSR
jgi:hypothetical protein